MTRVLSSEGGIRTPFGDQESVGGDAERHVVVKASPASTFIVIEAQFLWSRRGGGWNWVGVVSGLFNPNDSGVGALERRPRHDEGYHEGGGCGRRSFAFG